MTRDKQLTDAALQTAREKQRLEQALNVKEFALLAGISYSKARAWFHLPGFPAIRGVVFWEDFVIWRRCQAGLKSGSLESNHQEEAPETQTGRDHCAKEKTSAFALTPKAAQILAEAG